MIRPPSSALALLLTAASAFGADVNWDGGRVKGAASDPVVVAGARGSQPALGAPVNEKSLRRANEEVLRLREDVWAGQVAPEAFYAAVQEIYVRRFGAGYGPKVKAFLDAEAARAPRPAQAVDFAGMPVAAREAFFSAMPKGAELHLHLTGAIPADTMMKIGEELGTDLPIANVKKILGAQDLAAYGVDAAKTSLKIAQMSTALRKALAEALVSRDGEDFMAFLTKWQIIGPITSDPRAYDPMMGSMADYAKRQGILYLELMVAGNETSLTAAAESARRVQAESGVTIRLIGYSSWGMKNETVDAGLAKAGEIREVVGYNMVANEKN
ncbi:MAG: hypothetical protein HYZ74_03290, partial [Elusimicrobia bacterium]|nr:hypothetical protein [Elusimicrobiota bacterium]